MAIDSKGFDGVGWMHSEDTSSMSVALTGDTKYIFGALHTIALRFVSARFWNTGVFSSRSDPNP